MARAIVSLLWLLGFTTLAYAQGQLEIPAPGSQQSGVGLISGWKCTGTTLTAAVDGMAPLPVPYGSPRGDTQGICNDTDNGFGVLINWNLLGNGAHTLRLYDNGVEFASATFTVQTLGGEFLRGLSKTVEVPNFPNAGQTTTLQWSEAAQNFVITGLNTGGNTELSALLGHWAFSFTIISTFTNRYDLQQIDTSTGTPAIIGEDEFGDPVVAGRVQDLTDEPFPYEFALLDPGESICDFFVFNQTGPDALSGRYIELTRTPTSCEPSSSTDYPMTGVRLSTLYSIFSFQTRGAKDALLVQEAQRVAPRTDESAALDPSVIALLVRQLQRHQ